MIRLLLLAISCLLGTRLGFGDEGFATGTRIDGYRGIWFTLGQFYPVDSTGTGYGPRTPEPTFPFGDKYSGGLATYTSKHSPMAVYAPQVHRTFFVYGGVPTERSKHLLCMISYFDHATGTVPQPVVVHDKLGVDDPHDNPSLSIDADGHLWVMVSGRSKVRPGFMYRSKRPHDIDDFELVRELEMTYPQIHAFETGEVVVLLTRYTGVRELYLIRDANQTDQKAIRLAGIREPGHRRGGHYQVSAIRDGVIGTFFNRHPHGDPDRRTDLYYLQSRDRGQTWTDIFGDEAELPLVKVGDRTRVVDFAAESKRVYLKDMDFDAAGRPVLLFLVARGHRPGPLDGPREFRVLSFDGADWRQTTVCPTDHNYDSGSLFISADRWRVVVPSAPGPQPDHAGGQIQVWQSPPGGKRWRLQHTAMGHGPRNHNYVRRVHHRHNGFAAFWADGDPVRHSRSDLYFADEGFNNIHRLPSTMTEPFAKPKLIRPSPGDP